MRSYILIITFLLSVFSFSNQLNAQTLVYEKDLNINTYWTKENSPYILMESIMISSEKKLIIDKGVTVMSASSTPTNRGYHRIFIKGKLSINGSPAEPVTIDGLNNFAFRDSEGDMNYTVFNNTTIGILLSTTTFNNVIVKNSEIAITIAGSYLSVNNSKIINNRIGFYIYDLFYPQTKIVDPSRPNTVKINNSSIYNNSQYGIINRATKYIDAKDNWWGSIDGPISTSSEEISDKVFGNIYYKPWKYEDIDIYKNKCCSNVLFIPGMEASRLYKDTNTLWEPNRNADIDKLYMNELGESIDNSIYTKDILDSAFGFKNIYKNLIAMMNGVVAEKTINKWLPFPYDWRMSIEDVVYGNTKVSTTSISLIKTIEGLAKDSKTGKVIIVAHSNGGLVSKLLLKALEEKGESNIVEKVIQIAVPELGTPQALLAMLHGYNQSILGGLFLSKNNSRTFSKNVPGAYGLLPSKEFFNRNSTNIITDVFSNNNNLFIDTYESMKEFLLNNYYSKSITDDINTPLLLNTNLISKSENTHSLIDSWKHSSTTNILSIIGWGLTTPEGIKYEKDKHCKARKAKICSVAFLAKNTYSGDGTVLTNSNSYNSDKTVFFNLKKMNSEMDKKINHANILESTEILNSVKNQISKNILSFDYGKYFTDTVPIDNEKVLTIKVYSPIDIHIYDKLGRHTGIIQNPVIGKDLESYENNINSSYYADFDRIKMIQVPYGDDYEIVLEGNDNGVFSLDIEISEQNNIIASTSFSELPVNPNMNIDLVVPTSTILLASSTVMNIDADGDGITEYIQNSDEYIKANPKSEKEYKKIKKIIKKISRKIHKKNLKSNEKINKSDKEYDN